MPMKVTGIREMTARVGRFSTELEATLRPAIIESAELVEHKAESNAASFSSEIPSHIHSSASFSARGGGAVIEVDEFDFPHRGKAHVFEGDGESPAPFLASNWGRLDGHVMETHPYLGPAAEEEGDEVRALIAAAVHEAFDL